MVISLSYLYVKWKPADSLKSTTEGQFVDVFFPLLESHILYSCQNFPASAFCFPGQKDYFLLLASPSGHVCPINDMQARLEAAKMRTHFIQLSISHLLSVFYLPEPFSYCSLSCDYRYLLFALCSDFMVVLEDSHTVGSYSIVTRNHNVEFKS